MRLVITIILSLGAAALSIAQAANLPQGPQRFTPDAAFDYRCIDYHKRPVLNVRNDTLNDVAFSDLMRVRGINMGPMTIFNYQRLKALSKASQKFFLAHECGHHVLGHLYFRRLGYAAEQEADCYAIRILIRRGKFTLKDIEDVQGDMRKYAQSSAFHKKGTDRAVELMNCLE